LTLEFAARNAQQLGGVIAFSGGLIGQEINRNNYQKDFQQTPIFIGCSDIDPHIPLARVHESEAILKEMNAAVTARIYSGMGHTINEDEIAFANKNILSR